MTNKYKKNNLFSKQSGGFTIVEFVISVSILAAITTLTIVGRPAYNDTILFTNLTYDVAQTIRQMQVLASVGSETASGSSNFEAGYGLYFDSDGDNKTYKTFTDYGPSGSPRDWRFENTLTEDDLLGTYNLSGGSSIQSVCRVTPAGVSDCSGVTNIVFLRPDLGACVNDGDPINGISADTLSRCVVSSGNSHAIITLVSPGARTKSIKVYSSGQIAID